jgi:hypothetical protein
LSTPKEEAYKNYREKNTKKKINRILKIEGKEK